MARRNYLESQGIFITKKIKNHSLSVAERFLGKVAAVSKEAVHKVRRVDVVSHRHARAAMLARQKHDEEEEEK